MTVAMNRATTAILPPELINKGYEIPSRHRTLVGQTLDLKQEAEIIKRIMMFSADHWPCVSGAYATILAACAGIGLPSQWQPA